MIGTPIWLMGNKVRAYQDFQNCYSEMNDQDIAHEPRNDFSVPSSTSDNNENQN